MELPNLNNVFGMDVTRLAEEARQQAALANELQQRLTGLMGRAESPDGRVQVAFLPEQGLPELYLDPRVLRLGSEELAELIQGVVWEAVQDLERQREEAARQTYGPDYDPSAAVLSDEEQQGLAHGIAQIAELAENTTADARAMVDRLQRMLQH